MFASLSKQFRRRRAYALHADRRREVARSLSDALGHPVTLTPASLGGYDDVLYARHQGRTLALVRVVNPHKTSLWINRKRAEGPVVSLAPELRVSRESSAYATLAPLGLAPRPLWTADDAVACEHLTMPRASEVLRGSPSSVLRALDLIFAGIRTMHDRGVTHLDLNLSNVLLSLDASRVVFIDFEYGPSPDADVHTQRAYDYLRLINSCLRRRRGGHFLANDYSRLSDMLVAHADEATLAADAAPLLVVIPKIARDPALRAALARAIPSLAPSA